MGTRADLDAPEKRKTSCPTDNRAIMPRPFSPLSSRDTEVRYSGPEFLERTVMYRFSKARLLTLIRIFLLLRSTQKIDYITLMLQKYG
jgi:hypothetical protein